MLEKVENDIMYVMAYPVRFAPMHMIVNSWKSVRPDVAQRAVDNLVAKNKLRIEIQHKVPYLYLVD